MDCPRCHLPLRREEYEGVEIDLCDSCWGTWLDSGELAEILESQELEFSDEESERVLSLMTASKPGPRGQLLCPRCGSFMEQLAYSGTVELVIDRCPKDGVWLDAGELKKAQVLAESAREIHNMIIRKLKLKRREDA